MAIKTFTTEYYCWFVGYKRGGGGFFAIIEYRRGREGERKLWVGKVVLKVECLVRHLTITAPCFTITKIHTCACIYIYA